MLEIYIEPRRTVNLKQAIAEAIESGEYESLATDIRDCFTEDQVEEIEEVLDSGDIEETIDEILAEWGGDDLDDLFDSIEAYFAEGGIELHFEEDDLELEPEETDIDEFDDIEPDEDDAGYEDEDEF